MAITILSQPTSPNASYTNLVYAITSSNYTQPQFQYVMDIYESGSATRLSRIKQYPNPQGKAVFDPHSIFNDYLDNEWFPATTGSLINVTNGTKGFTVQFGEEYGTSPTSAVTVYSNLATDNITVFQAVVDPNGNATNSNFPQIDTQTYGYNYPWDGNQHLLSDKPTTLPVWQTAFNTMGGISSNNCNGTLGASYDGDSSPGETTILIGGYIGQFFAGYINPAIQQHSTLAFYIEQCSPATPYEIKTFNIETCINYELLNFVFINNYGVFDNYTLDVPINTNSNITREEYKAPFVNYSTEGTYDQRRGGTVQYASFIDDEFTVTTPPLSQEEAAWLTQLIESPKVYIQIGNTTTANYPDANTIQFIPIVITNSNYSQNTNLRGQKLFQYEISYKFSNSRRGR